MSVKEWSPLQVNIFNAVKALALLPEGVLVVEAGPGSGKTTTGIECTKLVPLNHRATFLAFNKHIAEELKCRVPPNCDAATVNSYGFRAVREAYRGVRLDDWKTRVAMRDSVGDPDKRRKWDGPMKRLIGLKKATMSWGKKHEKGCPTLLAGKSLVNRYVEMMASGKDEQRTCECPEGFISLEANEIAAQFDLDLPTSPEFMEVAGQVWKKVINQTQTIDFDDMWFLPVLKKLPVPRYDWAFIDEAQDLSATQIELLKRIAPRIVAIGDPRQAIYGFRGADSDSMEKLKALPGAETLPLNICYRCPKAVVAKANEVFPAAIEHGPNAIDGTVDEVDVKLLRTECKPGSWVLCRTTAPLVKECLKFIVEGVKATVKGRDIGQQILNLIDKVGGSDIEDFSRRLEEFWQGEVKRLEAAGRDAQLQALEDRVESIHALAEGARTVADVKARIENTFKDEASSGVTFATAHRSKGLEADDIYLLCPELMPFPKAKSERAMRQEMNLKFVAYTRAMKRLRIVTGTKKKGAK